MSEMKLLRVAVIGICVVQASSVGAQTTAPTAPKAAAPTAATPTPGAAAQPKLNDSAAETTTATFGDWQLRCRKIAAPAAGQPSQACEVVQSVIVQGQTAPFAQLAFGKNAPGEALMVTAVVPTNISFPSTLRVSTEENDKQPVELAWTRCLPVGCFGSIAPKDDVLKRWRSMTEAGFFIFKNGQGQDLKVPFSFRGLSRALDALAKEG